MIVRVLSVTLFSLFLAACGSINSQVSTLPPQSETETEFEARWRATHGTLFWERCIEAIKAVLTYNEGEAEETCQKRHEKILTQACTSKTESTNSWDKDDDTLPQTQELICQATTCDPWSEKCEQHIRNICGQYGHPRLEETVCQAIDEKKWSATAEEIRDCQLPFFKHLPTELGP